MTDSSLRAVRQLRRGVIAVADRFPPSARLLDRSRARRREEVRRETALAAASDQLEAAQAQVALVEARLATVCKDAHDARGERDRAREERDRAREERDRSRRLLREQTRLWTESDDATESTALRSGPMASFVADGEFSYSKFLARKGDLSEPDNAFGLGPKAVERIMGEAGPVRFEHGRRADQPPSGVAFATVCTDKFCPGLEALVASLLAIYPQLAVDFWVYHDDGLTEFSRRRLLELYPNFVFADRDAQQYAAAAAGKSYNQARIGSLGYLTIEAMLLDQYRRVVVLDSDMIAVDDISALWSDPDDDDARVVADAGALPLTTVSHLTGRLVFNSGVISLPSILLGREPYETAKQLLPQMPGVTCPVLRDFADQKFWNVFLSRHEVTYLPTRYNTNKQLLDRYLPEHRGDASIIHYTNAKPWFRFASRELVDDEERQRSADDHRQYDFTFARWHETYRREVGRLRRQQFDEVMSDHLLSLRDAAGGRGAVLIGNGPSLAKTDLSVLSNRVSMAFNWFVHHDRFDEIEVDHLMVMSHMFFGGWHTVDPSFPDGWIERLVEWRHRPTLWFPYYFRPLIDTTEALERFDVRYLLLEKPFKHFVEQLGYLPTRLDDFLGDGRTGILTAGLPLALHLGCSDIVLVGCDASYGNEGSNDYFYAEGLHTSKSTRTSSLHSAWAQGGVAHACYETAVRETQRLGVAFADATIDGRLTAVPKRSIDGLEIE